MGGIISALGEAFPPASKFNVDSIPDLSGKVMLVTGGNTGLLLTLDVHMVSMFVFLTFSCLGIGKETVKVS